MSNGISDNPKPLWVSVNFNLSLSAIPGDVCDGGKTNDLLLLLDDVGEMKLFSLSDSPSEPLNFLPS